MANNTLGPTESRDTERTREAELAREERAQQEQQERTGSDGRVQEQTVQRPVTQSTQPAQIVNPAPTMTPYTGPYDTAAPVAVVAQAPAAPVLEASDRARWGAIWAGVLTTFAIFLVLEFLGIGLGLISPTNGAAGMTSGISTLIAGLIAFFIGGWVAETSSGARGLSSRLLHGFLVWALVTTLILGLSFLGLGTLFGALGSVAGQVASAGRSVTVGSVSAGQIGSATRLAGWGAFIWLVISALACMLGALIGLPKRAVGWRRW